MLNLILLLALVLAVVIWFWVKWYKVRNVGKRGGYLLIPCKKNTHELEHMVKSCYWEEFFQPEYYGREIILVQLQARMPVVVERAASHAVVAHFQPVVFGGLLDADCRLDGFIDCHRKPSVHNILESTKHPQ